MHAPTAVHSHKHLVNVISGLMMKHLVARCIGINSGWSSNWLKLDKSNCMKVHWKHFQAAPKTLTSKVNRATIANREIQPPLRTTAKQPMSTETYLHQSSLPRMNCGAIQHQRSPTTRWTQARRKSLPSDMVTASINSSPSLMFVWLVG